MALKNTAERFCAFSFYENGRVFSRRIHRIELQDRLGRAWTIDAGDLPESLSVHTGVSHKSKHLLELLLKPAEVEMPKLRAWLGCVPVPTARDVVAMALGYILFTILAVAAVVARGDIQP
jgi:hypothetical protein